MSKPESTCIHLVGSAPLANAEEVFRTVCAPLGPYLRRLPDGEIGVRRRWVGMLGEMLNRHASFEPDPDEAPFPVKLASGRTHRELKRLRIRPGVDPSAIRFETGYAAMAIDSFVIFDRLQREGVIPQAVKFQIALPSPLAPAYNYISQRCRNAFLETFTQHLIDEVHQIAMALPNDRLVIQWDVLHEILVWEGYFPDRPEDYKTQIAAVLGRIGDAVPPTVELGFHFCYGTPQGDYLVEPKDAGVMVEVMRETARHVRRPIQYFHFPVPQHRLDADFYRPLGKLASLRNTEFYVGMVQANDPEGNRKRLELARQFVPVAGVATECGWGRGNAAQVGPLLESLLKLVA